MNRFVEAAQALRDDPNIHYNCCQSVLIPFAKEKGLDADQIYALTNPLGGGLKAGYTCGAIIGGLMVLGLYKKDDKETLAAYYAKFKENHCGMTDCKALLNANKEAGNPQKPHCDALVRECAQAVCEILNLE